MLSLLCFMIIGAVAGWLASHSIVLRILGDLRRRVPDISDHVAPIDRGRGFGFGDNLAVGIIGGLLGGLIYEAVGLSAYGTDSLIEVTFAALVFVFLLQLIKKS